MAAALSSSLARLNLQSNPLATVELCIKTQRKLKNSFYFLLTAMQEKTLAYADVSLATQRFELHASVIKHVSCDLFSYEYLDLSTSIKTDYVASSLLIQALDLEKPLFVDFDRAHRQACAREEFYIGSLTETKRRARELFYLAEKISDSLEVYYLFLKYITNLPKELLKDQQQFTLPASTAKFFFSAVVKKNTFTHRKQIGEGTYGKVFHVDAVFKSLAFKEFKAVLDDAQTQILHEASFYLLIPPHPHLLKLEALTSKGIFFELASTDLYHHLKKPLYHYEKLCRHFFALASVLSHIHEQGYNYKDLKPSNILVFPNDNIKLCDLGFLEPSKEDTQRVVCGHFAAPEYEPTLVTTITPKADVWAFGVCLFQALTKGKYLLLGLNSSHPDYFQRVLAFSKKYPVTQEYLFHSLESSDQKILMSRDPERSILPIVAACLRFNPKERPSMQELKQFFHEKTPQLHPPS
jgi:hypothetical protein